MTFVKKLTLLLGVVMAAAALAGPATASAYSNWTATNIQGEYDTEWAYTELEGRYKFTPAFDSNPAYGSFQCDVKMPMVVGQGKTPEAWIGDPEITNPQTCEGQGRWSGCQLDDASFQFGENLLSPSALLGNYSHETDLSGCSFGYSADAALEEVEMQPTVNAQGELVSIQLSGSTPNWAGGVLYELGTFTISEELPEGELGVIGLE